MRKTLFSLLLGALFVLVSSEAGFAQDLGTVGDSMSTSAQRLPGLLAMFAYISGIILCVTGLLKLVDHVTNPSQTKLGVPVVRFLVGGALFSLPIIAEAVKNTIGLGGPAEFGMQEEGTNFLGALINKLATLNAFGSLGFSANAVMGSMISAVDFVPALISMVAYLLGLIAMVSALYKTKDHVENPDRVPIKDAIIRYLLAGALFALPTLYTAMYSIIAGSELGLTGALESVRAYVSFIKSSQDGGVAACDIDVLTNQIPQFVRDLLPEGIDKADTLGVLICNTMVSTAYLPSFLNAIAYMIGLVLGVWGVMKIRDHVNEPSRTGLNEGIMRLIAGGAFFALPYVLVVLQQSIFTDSASLISAALAANYGFNETDCAGGGSLDLAMGCVMQNLLGPVQVGLNFFGYVAGAIFIMIGISRLIKSAQEGPRGPGGIGTFGTFIIGAMLLSASTLIQVFSATIFSDAKTYTYAQLANAGGMDAQEQAAVLNVISAVLRFLIIIGMISFVRGLFIMRDVAEGKGNASTMAGMTHIIGGALAVNMGPLLNAVQATLGIGDFGVAFGL
ncbi:MAG: hypothetical protein ACLFP8_03120 [Alphaproteobacteria bacterium]